MLRNLAVASLLALSGSCLYAQASQSNEVKPSLTGHWLVSAFDPIG